MIAAEAHTPLERVRKKLEETFGQFELVADAGAARGRRGGELRLDVQRRRSASRRLVEIEYQKEGEETSSTRVVEPYVARARAAELVRVHTWDRTRDGERSFRLDRMREREAARARRSSRARASSRAGCATPAPRASSTRRRSRAGRSSAARGRSRDGTARRRPARRQPRVARERDLLATAARPSCSSPRTCARTFATARRSSRRSSASTACASRLRRQRAA